MTVLYDARELDPEHHAIHYLISVDGAPYWLAVVNNEQLILTDPYGDVEPVTEITLRPVFNHVPYEVTK